MALTWQDRFNRIRDQLKEDFPDETPEWIYEEAHKLVRREWGPETTTESKRLIQRVEAKRLDFGDWYWLIWIVAFLVVEIPAAIWKPTWTFSHHVWKWFNIDKTPTWWRWLALTGFLVGIIVHFSVGWSAVYFALFTPLMLASIIYYYVKEAPLKKKTQLLRLVDQRPDLPRNMVEVEKPPYSPKKGVLKAAETVGQIVVAVGAAMLPQLLSLLASVLSNTPPETLHVPAEWATFWFISVRVFSNWVKNR